MSQARAAYPVRPGDVAEMKQVAARLESDNPLWIVVFGHYTKEFVAFPRFDVPRGTLLAARYADALPPRMRAVESRALPTRPQAPREAGQPPCPSRARGRSGDVAG